MLPPPRMQGKHLDRYISNRVSACICTYICIHACWASIQGDLLNQLLEQNANSGIKAQGPAAQKAFQVVGHQMCTSYATQNKNTLAQALDLYYWRQLSLQQGLSQRMPMFQELSQNRMVSQSSSQAPTLASNETTNADNSPLDKASEQVYCLGLLHCVVVHSVLCMNLHQRSHLFLATLHQHTNRTGLPDVLMQQWS